MSDDLSESLRRLDRYPGRGDRLDPSLVVDAARRRLRARRLGAATGAGTLVVALVIAVPVVLGAHGTDPLPPVSTGGGADATPAPTPTSTGPCAEFPPVSGLAGDVEGWWSSSPADAQGTILRDPAQWPPEPREHPRVALVDTDTATVISSWDRITCGPDPTFVPTPQPDWPAHSVAVVDMSTGGTIEVFASPAKR